MRLKCRFYVCELDFGSGNSEASGVSALDVYMAVKNSMQSTWGDAGWGQASNLLAVKLWHPAIRIALVRGPLELQAEVHSALALIRSVKKQPVAVRVIQVAGCLRTVKEALQQWYAIAADTGAGGAASAGAGGSSGGGSGGRKAGTLDSAFFNSLEAEGELPTATDR